MCFILVLLLFGAAKQRMLCFALFGSVFSLLSVSSYLQQEKDISIYDPKCLI